MPRPLRMSCSTSHNTSQLLVQLLAKIFLLLGRWFHLQTHKYACYYEMQLKSRRAPEPIEYRKATLVCILSCTPTLRSINTPPCLKRNRPAWEHTTQTHIHAQKVLDYISFSMAPWTWTWCMEDKYLVVIGHIFFSFHSNDLFIMCSITSKMWCSSLRRTSLLLAITDSLMHC